MLKSFFLFIIICSSSVLLAQKGKINGVVVSSNKQQFVIFANVLLKDSKSDLIVANALTDKTGFYSLDSIAFGYYELVVSHLSYESKVYEVFLDSSKIDTNMTIVLEPSKVLVDGVTVKGKKSIVEIDRIKYVVGREEKKKSLDALVLLEETVPEIDIDKMQNSVKVGQSRVKLLINGRSVDFEDVLALDKMKVNRIDFFDLPMLQYSQSGYEYVVDIITNRTQSGFDVNLNARNGLFKGIGNDLLSFETRKGLFYFDMSVNYGYQKEDELETLESTQYFLETASFSKEKYGDSNDFSFGNLRSKVGIGVWSKNKFDVFLGLSSFLSHQDGSVSQSVMKIKSGGYLFNGMEIYSDTISNKRTKAILFGTKKLAVGDVSLNVVLGSQNNYFKHPFTELNSTGDTLFYSNYFDETNKINFSSELNFDHSFKTSTLTSGLQWRSSTLSREEATKVSTGYGYVGFSHKKKKWSCNVGGGIQLMSIRRIGVADLDEITVIPKVTLMYKINKQLSSKFFYDFQPFLPTFSQMNSTVYAMDSLFWRAGNPNLKSSYRHRVSISTSYRTKSIFLNTRLYFVSVSRKIGYGIFADENRIVLRPVNYQAENEFGYRVSGRLKVKKWLTISPMVSISNTKITPQEGENWEVTQLYWKVKAKAWFKELYFSLSYNSPYSQVNGNSLHTQGSSALVGLFWNKSKYSLGIEVNNILGQPWEKSIETNVDKYLYRYSESAYHTWSKLILFSARVQINSQKYQGPRKKKNQQDNDSGILNAIL